MAIEMKIKGLMIDPITNMPIVILKNISGESVLPIWVGIFEANAIALQVENITTPRPMTHDLIKSILDDLDATLMKIVICELKDSTFYANIFLKRNGKTVKIDSRPSDAIALALRTDASIFVEESVVEQAKSIDLTNDTGETVRLKKLLENLSGDDLGQYEM
jgi:bifunctional DNase/RNase